MPNSPSDPATTIADAINGVPHELDAIGRPSGLYHLGQGTCGAVWQHTNSLHYVCKLASNTNIPTDDPTTTNRGLGLWNEVVILRAVSRIFKQVKFTAVHIPEFREFQYNGPENRSFFVMEKIKPVPKHIQRALVDFFYPNVSAEVIVESLDAEPSHCLIHPLLGETMDGQTPERITTLKNFEMTKDQLEELGVDTSEITRSMAQALAIMHFTLGVDAHGVKFVLGAQPCMNHYSYGARLQGMNDRNHAVNLWMFDFNKVSPMPTIGDFMRMGVKAFVENQKYYPLPAVGPARRAHQTNWAVFCGAYQEKVWELALPEDREVGAMFLYAVETHYLRKQRAAAAAEENEPDYGGLDIGEPEEDDSEHDSGEPQENPECDAGKPKENSEHNSGEPEENSEGDSGETKEDSKHDPDEPNKNPQCDAGEPELTHEYRLELLRNRVPVW